MQNMMKSALVGAALLAMTGGCSSEDECETAADCGDQPALEAGEVYACQEQKCAAVAQPYAVYGLKDGHTVYSLGTWPSLSAAATPLFEVVAPEDRQLDPANFEITYGGYLTNDGKRLLSGYTRGDVSGNVALYTFEGSSTRYIPVPGNLDADGFNGAFYVSGTKAADFSAGAAVYALTEAQPVLVADTGSTKSFSGHVALADNGTATFGYFDTATGGDRLAVFVPSAYASASAAAPLNLATGSAIAGTSLGAARFGAGVAVLRGNYDAKFNLHLQDVARADLAGSGNGNLVPVLRIVDACTNVSLQGGIGADLLVRVTEKGGARRRQVVRITQKAGAPAGAVRTPASDCEAATYDAQLGTLELQAGFAVVDSAPLPDGVGAVTVVPVAP